MPYKLVKEEDQWCVDNKETGERKGCSATRPKAVAHMRALYAVEGGAKMGKKDIDTLVFKSLDEYFRENPQEVPKEWDADDIEKSLVWIQDEVQMFPPFSYYSATSYSDLDDIKASEEVMKGVNDLLAEFPFLARNIIENYEIKDKFEALINLAFELAERVSNKADESEDTEAKEMAEKAVSRRRDVSEADKKRAQSEYGDVTYADEANKKYPLDTEKHIRAAWSYINMSRNAKKYSSSDLKKIKGKIVRAWKNKVNSEGPPQAKKGVNRMIASALSAMKELFIDTPDDIAQKDDILKDGVADQTDELMVWKEVDNEYRWLARYSNNFRDRDTTPEIISASSHKAFVEKVEKGLAPMPELWLWHVKEWKVGQATWVAYDEAGFALAAGVFNKGCEPIAEWLSKQKNWKVSHGMPNETIVRDPQDKTVIIEHETREISFLPPEVAANEITGFGVMKKESEMIPENKRNILLEQWNLAPNVLEDIEKQNLEDAKKATVEGIESKEKVIVGDTTTQEQKDETLTTETPEKVVEEKKEESTQDAKENEQPAPLTREEVADAFVKTFSPLVEKVESLVAQLGSLDSDVQELKKSKQETVMDTIASTPPASLAALLTRRVIGDKDAEVQGNSKLAKSKPKETEPLSEPRTGVPFIDKMLSKPEGE